MYLFFFFRRDTVFFKLWNESIILCNFISKILWIPCLFFMTSWHKWIVVNSVSLWRHSLIWEIILPLTLHTLQLDCAVLFRNKIVTSVKQCNLENSSLLKRLGLSFKTVFSENLFISSHCNLAFPDSPPSLLTHYLSFLVYATFGSLIKPASVLF